MPAQHKSMAKQGTNGASSIGAAPLRADALDKVTGRSLYPGDLVRPDMLHMKTVFAGRPHARLLSLDTAAALAAPGVVAVFTAADVPVNEYGLITYDQPVIVGPGSAKAGSDVARCEGDTVALGMRFDAMEYFNRGAMRRNPVVPSPRHMERRVEPEDTIGEGVATAEVVEKPAVNLGISKGLLNLIHALMDGCNHREHLIVARPSRQ